MDDNILYRMWIREQLGDAYCSESIARAGTGCYYSCIGEISNRCLKTSLLIVTPDWNPCTYIPTIPREEYRFRYLLSWSSSRRRNRISIGRRDDSTDRVCLSLPPRSRRRV
jgi:hypothetical protein